LGWNFRHNKRLVAARRACHSQARDDDPHVPILTSKAPDAALRVPWPLPFEASNPAIGQAMQDVATEVQLRDEEGGIRPDYLHAVSSALDDDNAAKVRELTLDLHEGDLADLIELLNPDQRERLIATLGKDFKPAALTELEEGVRDQLL
jgi:hypothetical protein